MKKVLLFAAFCSGALPALAQQSQLKDIRFNLYADSIKPVLNYYVNVEGMYDNGRILPLDDRDILLEADWGEIKGNEWVIPKTLEKDRVLFTATARENPELRRQITVYIQKRKDPRDQ